MANYNTTREKYIRSQFPVPIDSNQVSDNFITRRDKYIQKQLPTFEGSKKGRGLINKMINACPIEVHPGPYRYLGPGTHLDLRLEKGIKPYNKLDALALEHDKAYAESNDLNDRHKADYKLQEGAWSRFLDPSASIGERSMGYATNAAMKLKRKVGGSIRTSNYIKYPVTLNDEEQQLILHAKKPVTLVLDNTRFVRTKASVSSNTFLPVTTYQLKKIKNALHNKKTVEIKLPLKQLEYIRANNKVGGFLPALLASAPVIAALGSLGTNIYNAYQNKKTNDRLVTERIRHNKALESKKGAGVKRKSSKKSLINTDEVPGNGLFEQLMKKSKKKKSLL